MKIKIAERLRPFCHLPGTSCMIPWSGWKVRAFPTLLEFENLLTGEKWEQQLEWKGPVAVFTVELDLEKGVVWVYGKTGDGYRKICIAGPEISIGKKPPETPIGLERLSLGMSKKLDWELVCRRRNMAEILPIWFRLGQMVPSNRTTDLFHPCDKTEVDKLLQNIFLVCFEGILMPRLSDTQHQGMPFSAAPLALLAEGARYIRSLFFSESEDRWSFLPCLAPQYHAGRFVQLGTTRKDKIDFEWSKKLLKKVVIQPAESRQIFLTVPKPLKECRLQKGKRHSLDEPLFLTAGQTVLLDRFEK